jgi:hypothetical protein
MAEIMTTKLSEDLATIAQACEGGDTLSLKELIGLIPSRAQALMVLVLCFPFLFFIPVPGLSIIFGAFIFFNGYRIAMNKAVWIPRYLLKKRISVRIVLKTISAAQRVLKRIEKYIRPRGKYLHSHKWIKPLNGWILAACGFFLALPLPPGTNFLPAVTASCLSLGILESDGLFISISYGLFVVTATLYILLPIIGIEKLFQIWS